MRRPVRMVVLGLVVALGAGCTGDDQAPDPTSSTSAAPAGSTTSTPSTTTTTDPAPDEMVVQVFFLDEDAFNTGRAPYVTPVERSVDADAPIAGALDELFRGPNAEERARGLRFIASEATGYTNLGIDGGTAHVQLAGGCSSGGSTFTVADQIAATLRQFREVEAVKIYDPDGGTGAPDTPGDSIPTCLEP